MRLALRRVVVVGRGGGTGRGECQQGDEREEEGDAPCGTAATSEHFASFSLLPAPWSLLVFY